MKYNGRDMEINTYKLPDSLPADLDRMRSEVEKFRTGAISAAEFRSFRVPQGVYEERTEGNFMLRVRLPAGALMPHQMHTLADVSRRLGSGTLHVTTRQDIQVHSVKIDALCDALETLADSGLSTRGGGGNGVRNITSCHDAGVCPEEIFDVRPYAVALTERLIDNPDNYRLPRKYKIAFAGCPADCGGAVVNDLGFIAKKRNDIPGFAVYAGGGMGAKSAIGSLLEEFIPAEDCFRVAEAVKRVFDARGDRRNKHKARLRFLISQIGIERFRELYQVETQKLAARSETVLTPKEMPSVKGRREKGQKGLENDGSAFKRWEKRNVMSQKQDGLNTVSIPLLSGDISADMLEKLAETVSLFGDGTLYTTQWQNLRLHNVSEALLPELHALLDGAGLAESLPKIIRNTTACTGVQTCKLGICLSRGMAGAVSERLVGMGEQELDAMGSLKISISGCPNACGRHPVGDIGLFGGARRVNGRLAPHYTIQLGGRLGEGRTRLAETVDVLHARNVPRFIEELLKAFTTSTAFPDFDAFLQCGGRRSAAAIASQHNDVPTFEADKNYYYDYGAEELFSLAGRGPGECGAGVFDLIEVDIKSAGESLAGGDLLQAAALAARALLVTRGEEARDNLDALKLFKKHFIVPGLVKGKARDAAELALNIYCNRSSEQEPETAGVRELIERVQCLYDNMDQSLKFDAAAENTTVEDSQPAVKDGRNTGKAPASCPAPDREADFRGVACPLNYVKTKMALGPMKSGQVLSVLVDEEGCKNVPESIRKDGHEVISTKRTGEHYSISIRKK